MEGIETMDVRQQYHDYVKESIKYLLEEDQRPLKMYRIIEILKVRIACSELQVKKALEELVDEGTISINKDGMYLYVSPES